MESCHYITSFYTDEPRTIYCTYYTKDSACFFFTLQRLNMGHKKNIYARVRKYGTTMAAVPFVIKFCALDVRELLGHNAPVGEI